jgi:uncharacterized protein YcbK (DUF882 family)
MLSLKNDVNLNGAKPEIAIACLVVYSVYRDFGYDCVLTSANDGQHGFGSLHYAGLAVDFRTHHVQANDIEPLADTIREALGPQFDVVLEDTHIHVEFQPK